MISVYSAFFETLLPLAGEPDEAAALLGDLLMSSTEAAIVATDLEGRIVLWNAGASRLYGYSPEEAIGRSSEEILQPAAERTVRHNRVGEPVGFVFVSRDISSQLRLRTGRAASEVTQIKSEFLANMSHELRTPLNGIIGFSELLFDGRVGALDQQHQQFLGHILTSSRHLLQLVTDILDLARVDAGQMVFAPEQVDPDHLARQVRDVLRSMAANKHQQVRIEVDPALGPVVADVGRLKQVLYNYLSNAIKFTPEHGRITIRLQPVGDAMFRLAVEDTGVGVQSEDLDRLFVEFEQLDSSTAKLHQGTGLGLALTKRIVEAQGGMVAVQSTPGNGSTFSAVLPRHLSADDVLAARPQPDAASLDGPTLLVVEHDSEDRRFLQDTFSNAGYVVETATTLADGLARCQERSFQAITLDLLLPDGPGLDLVRAIRAGGPNVSTPVVVISLLPDDGITAELPIHGYIAKPLVSEILVQELARIGSGAIVLVLSDDADNRATMAESLRDRGYRPIFAAEATAEATAGASGPPEIPAAVLVDPSMLSGRAVDRMWPSSGNADFTPILAWAGNRMPAAERAQLDLSLRSVVLSGPQ